MKAKYEEKTFEGYFNAELDRKCEVYFPLGQVQEGVIGADATAFSTNRNLWRLIGFPFISSQKYKGVRLSDIADEMEEYLKKEVKHIPDIKSNILFQYKRPEYITKSTGSEWPYWKRKYFRYTLYKEQQDLLMHIENSFGNDVLALYAAPAVESINDLISLKQNNKIIESTNFRKASELNDHHRNTYVEAGSYSQAFSEPERIENIDLIETINSARKDINEENFYSIVRFSGVIHNLMLESKAYAKATESRLQEYEGIEKYKLLYSIIAMSVFREITGAQWLLSVERN